MHPFLFFWRDFPYVVHWAGKGQKAHRDFSNCEVPPPSPLARDCPATENCGIECILHWYLSLRGIKTYVEFGWKFGVKR